LTVAVAGAGAGGEAGAGAEVVGGGLALPGPPAAGARRPAPIEPARMIAATHARLMRRL
jgi:hypothetical protein